MNELPAKARRKKQIIKNRVLILKSAKELFVKNGLAKITMDDIALASGFDRRTLYNHFKNKEEIFSALICDAISIIKDSHEKASALNASPVDKLKNLIFSLLDFYTENSTLVGMFVSELDRSDNKRKKQISSLMHENISAYRKLESKLYDMIKEAQEKGQVIDVHPYLLSGLLSIMLIRSAVILEQNKKSLTKEDITRDILKLIQQNIIEKK